MDLPEWAPPDVDLTRPNVARMYDYYLGGSHNFAVDRRTAQQAIDDWPAVPMIIRANRAFMSRAVRHLTEAGVRQFLDLGSGIPTVGNVHEVARTLVTDARVVYVDHDPVAVRQSRAILGGDPYTRVIEADLRHPDLVLSHRLLHDLLDLDQPVALLMVAVLHFVADHDDPAGIIAGYRDALPPGSYLAVSHATADGQQQDQAAEHRQLYARTTTPMTMRSHAQISHLLDGWDLFDPGLVRLPLWRPDPGETGMQDPESFAGFAAVGRKAATT
ncbi:MAG TPA: SAM-dependent methyltransferase [Rugosimonospora sp.]|nr:SAM-dependent methyltransferase [Rugosimonospora sp.]